MSAKIYSQFLVDNLPRKVLFGIESGHFDENLTYIIISTGKTGLLYDSIKFWIV